MKPNLTARFVCIICLLVSKYSHPQNFNESIFYRLTNQGHGESQSLDVPGDGSGKTLFLSPSNSYSGQAWKLVQQSSGHYKISCEWLGEGKSLGVINDKEKNKVRLEDTKNYTGQLWMLIPLDGGYFRIVSAWLGKDKSLEVSKVGTDHKLQLAPTANSVNQRWLVKPFSSGPGNKKEISKTEPTQPNSFPGLSEEEEKLYQLVMQYRKQNGLPAIKLSPSLTFVAQTHVTDLVLNQPDTCNGNSHSWSDRGNWSACCFELGETDSCMWTKPRELTSYKGNGFEIAYGENSPSSANYIATSADALASWKSSSPHKAVILNKDIWEQFPWKAIGIGINKGFAVIWFGAEPDND